MIPVIQTVSNLTSALNSVTTQKIRFVMLYYLYLGLHEQIRFTLIQWCASYNGTLFPLCESCNYLVLTLWFSVQLLYKQFYCGRGYDR